MEIHSEELKIVDIYRKNLLKEYTLQQLMRALRKKSYNWMHKAVTRLGKSILVIRRSANALLVKINLSDPKTIAYLGLLDIKESFEKSPSEVYDLMIEIIKIVSRKSPYFTLLVAGSYSIGKQKQGSDLDLVIITPNTRMKKEIRPYLKEATRLSSIPVEAHIFTKDEFYSMIISDEENFGKEVFRKHLLFYGTEGYYQIVKEAIQNGLQSKI